MDHALQQDPAPAWLFADAAATLRTTLWLLFAGLVLVVVDLTINGFDLIPDIVGYGLIALAGWRLRQQPVDDPSIARFLRTAGTLAVITAALFAIGWLVDLAGIDAATAGPDSLLSWSGEFFLVVMAVTAWTVFEGLSRWLDRYGLDAARHTRLAGRLLAGVSAAYIAAVQLSFVLPEVAVGGLLLVAVLLFTSLVFSALSLLLTIRALRQHTLLLPPEPPVAAGVGPPPS